MVEFYVVYICVLRICVLTLLRRRYYPQIGAELSLNLKYPYLKAHYRFYFSTDFIFVM